MYEDHFNHLKTFSDFNGNSLNDQDFSGRKDSVAAIEELFVNSAITVSSTVVSGVEKDALSSIFANVIKPIEDQNISDYTNNDDRLLYLLKNYDPSSENVDGIGATTVEWKLVIKDYKKKKKF